jgi:putative transposase
MSKSNVIELSGREETGDPLTELLRQGARTLIQQVVEAELVELLAKFEGRRLEDGRAAVVRNGYQPERAIQTGIGPVTVKIPKVRAKCGEPVTFRSAVSGHSTPYSLRPPKYATTPNKLCEGGESA